MLLGTAERSQGELAEALQRIGGSLRVSGDADRLLLAGESLRGRAGRAAAACWPRCSTGGSYPKPPGRGRGGPAGRPAAGAPVAAGRAGRRGLAAPRCTATTPTAASTRRPTRCSRCRRPRCARRTAAGSCPTAACWCWSATSRRPGRSTRSPRRWPGGTPTGAPEPVPAVRPAQPGPLLLVDRPGAVQSNLRVGGAGAGAAPTRRTPPPRLANAAVRRLLLLPADR